MMTTISVKSICGICPGGCGVNVKLTDGKVEKITPIKGHPVGTVCVRGLHSKEIIYSRDRLRHPLLRVGEKGEGVFRRITWDQALDRIAQAFQKAKDEYGAEAVMTYFGRGSFDFSFLDMFGAPYPKSKNGITGFLFPFGSPNGAGVASLCAMSYGMLAPIATFGATMYDLYPDFENSDMVVVWGTNPPTDSPPNKLKKILAAKRRGARVIVIDQMRSDMAKLADQWIGLRSGTDGALALGMIHVIVNERLYDVQFVQDWTTGFEELRGYVQQFSPENVEKITRVPRNVMVELARAIAGSKTALLMYTGLEYSNCGVQSIRAVLCLWAITGNIDVTGGMMFRPPSPATFQRIKLDSPQGVKPIGADKYPYFCDLLKTAQFMEVPRAILHNDPYPIKTMLIYGASILTSMPDPEMWKKCFKQLDFMAIYDRFMTADALYADIILPGTPDYESVGYHRYPGGYCQLRQKVIDPIEEAKSGYAFLSALAEKLGYGDLFPATEEDCLKFVFDNAPVSLEELKEHPEGLKIDSGRQGERKYAKGLLRKGGKPGFNTLSGKIELASNLLKEYGYDALPVYVEPIEGPLANPGLYKKYPLVFNSGARIQSTFRSQHLNIPGLLRMQPKPQVLINPLDAERRAIENGDNVWVESPRGRVSFWAKVTKDIMEGQVEVNVGGGSPIHADGWREANTNYLTDFENRDPISGFPVYKALLCEVKKQKSD